MNARLITGKGSGEDEKAFLADFMKLLDDEWKNGSHIWTVLRCWRMIQFWDSDRKFFCWTELSSELSSLSISKCRATPQQEFVSLFFVSFSHLCCLMQTFLIKLHILFVSKHFMKESTRQTTIVDLMLMNMNWIGFCMVQLVSSAFSTFLSSSYIDFNLSVVSQLSLVHQQQNSDRFNFFFSSAASTFSGAFRNILFGRISFFSPPRFTIFFPLFSVVCFADEQFVSTLKHTYESKTSGSAKNLNKNNK